MSQIDWKLVPDLVTKTGKGNGLNISIGLVPKQFIFCYSSCYLSAVPLIPPPMCCEQKQFRIFESLMWRGCWVVSQKNHSLSKLTQNLQKVKMSPKEEQEGSRCLRRVASVMSTPHVWSWCCSSWVSEVIAFTGRRWDILKTAQLMFRKIIKHRQRKHGNVRAKLWHIWITGLEAYLNQFSGLSTMNRTWILESELNLNSDPVASS